MKNKKNTPNANNGDDGDGNGGDDDNDNDNNQLRTKHFNLLQFCFSPHSYLIFLL